MDLASRSDAPMTGSSSTSKTSKPPKLIVAFSVRSLRFLLAPTTACWSFDLISSSAHFFRVAISAAFSSAWKLAWWLQPSHSKLEAACLRCQMNQFSNSKFEYLHAPLWDEA